MLTVLAYAGLSAAASEIHPDLKRIFKDADATRYQSIQDRINPLYVQAERRNIPVELLSGRLLLGIRKHIPAERLLATLKEDFQILSDSVGVLDIHFPQLRPHERDASVKALFAYRRSGVKDEVVEAVMEMASNKERTTSAALAALDAVSRMASAGTAADSDLIEIGRSLLESDLPTQGLGTVASFYLKAVSRRIGNDEIVHMIVQVLGEGGGIIQLEQELQRRTRRR